tara:strand:+ start:138 stop:512 length:375 start_codon:yes stop_codon:yes gene_type:complete
VINLAAVKKKKVPEKQGNNREVGYKKPPKGKQFEKGVSGNPNGRPKKEFALNDHIRSLANVELEDKRTMLEAVIGKVYEEALDGNMTAVNFLADRMLGRPQQAIGIKDLSDEPIKVFDIDGLDN